MRGENHVVLVGEIGVERIAALLRLDGEHIDRGAGKMTGIQMDFLAYYYPNDPEMLDYFCSFIVSGNMSLALTWIDGGMKQTAEEMAVLAGEIIMHGVKVLETKA